MKTNEVWRMIARRTAIIVVGAVCLTVLTGCPWDDDDLAVPTSWEVSWNPDPSGLSPQTLVVPWDDLTAAKAVDEMVDINGITYHVTLDPGPPVVIVIDDTTSQAKLTLTSTFLAPDNGSGTYDGIEPDGTAFNGNWNIWQN